MQHCNEMNTVFTHYNSCVINAAERFFFLIFSCIYLCIKLFNLIFDLYIFAGILLNPFQLWNPTLHSVT